MLSEVWGFFLNGIVEFVLSKEEKADNKMGDTVHCTKSVKHDRAQQIVKERNAPHVVGTVSYMREYRKAKSNFLSEYF